MMTTVPAAPVFADFSQIAAVPFNVADEHFD